MLDKSKKIDRVVADGNMVAIVSRDGSAALVSRREAIERARAIQGLDGESQDLVEALLLAANEARKHEKGAGYGTKFLDAIRMNAKIKDAKQKKSWN